MNILGIIPARFASTRFPGKPLHLIAGQSLIQRVIQRCQLAKSLREVIVATNATVDGQTTAHYLADRLQPFSLTISRLAHGVPVGGELDYLDDGTLIQAMKARQKL